MEKETARVHHVMAWPGPSRSRPFDRCCAAPRAPLWAPAASALLSGGRDALPSGRSHVARGKSDRALGSAHFATSALPGESHYVHALCCSSSGHAGARGSSGQSRRLARTFPSEGVMSGSGKKTPVSCRARGGDPQPDHPGRGAPARRGHQSLTPKMGCNRGPPIDRDTPAIAALSRAPPFTAAGT